MANAQETKKILTHDQLWDVLVDLPSEFSTPSNVQRFRNYTSPDVSNQRTHPGRANDPNRREMTHGVKLIESEHSGTLINPKKKTNYEQRQFNANELVYERNRTKLKQDQALPKTIDKYETTFGIKTISGERVGDIVNPKISQPLIEYDYEQPRGMYLLSHKSFEPGEQLNRNYISGDVIRQQTFGLPTPVYKDGRFARASLNWIDKSKSVPIISQTVHEYDESRSDDSNIRMKRFLEQTHLDPNHRFGLMTSTDRLSAGEVIHQRPQLQEQIVYPNHNISTMFDDKELTAIAKVRAHLCSLNMHTFKTQLQAFQFYDENQDGYISQRELSSTIEKNFNLNLNESVISAVMRYCDFDHDGQLNFLEFSNFLCYRVAHASGLEKLIENNLDVKKQINNASLHEKLVTVLKDSYGRNLLFLTDIEEKTGKYYVRKLVTQMDEMVPDGWKTSYDKINEAPFRSEPQVKRVYGLPSIDNNQHDYSISKNRNKHQLGANTIVGSLLSPSIWSERGLTENDLLKPKTMEEIRDIFAAAQIPVSSDDFVYAWTKASEENSGHVSFATFKDALDLKNRKLGNYQ
ncbi:unnamed protein product, partial [Didymodactylos carnosus]